MVGHGDSRHPLRDDLVKKIGKAGSPVEHRVLGVHVQMHELLGCHLNTLTFRADLARTNAPPQGVKGVL